MDIPADWIPEAELAAAISVFDGDRSKFHRNLLNWRHHGLLPDCYDGLPVPMVRPLGVGPGNEAVYPPVTIAMVRRIDELRRQSPRDMDEWLWQLWLDAYPIDIIKWCRERLLGHAEMISDIDQKRLVEAATRKPAKRSDGRRTFYRRLKARGWFALMTWAVNVAIGARGTQSLFDPASPPLAALANLVEPIADHSSARDRLVGSGIEDMALVRLFAVLDEANATELERVRVDCCAWSRAAEKHDLVGFILSRIWRKPDVRAVILPGLIALRRSPDHQGSLAAGLGISGARPMNPDTSKFQS
jgi:hypothetical protein